MPFVRLRDSQDLALTSRHYSVQHRFCYFEAQNGPNRLYNVILLAGIVLAQSILPIATRSAVAWSVCL